MDKPLRDLIEIIHFTENVSAKIHGLLDEAEIYRAVREEFAKSERYTVSILLLTDDGSKLRIAEASVPPGKLKAGEKAAGVRLKGYKIDLNKSSIYSQVVREGKTVQVNVSDIIGELFPRPLAHLISKTMGYEKTPSILTPLRRHGKIIGTLAISSTDLAEHFIPSVRNLAQHISTALELADEYAERVRAEEELVKYRDHLKELVEERTAELIKANKQLQQEITERKRAEEEIKQRNRELAALNTIAAVVSQSLNLDEILNAALDKVLELMPLDVGGIYLADPERRKLDLVVHRGISKEFAHEVESVNVDEKTLEAVMAEGKLGRFILSVKAVVKDRVELKRILSAMKKEGLSLASSVPVLLQAKEEILGLMTVASRVPRQFSEAELQLLTSIGQQIATAIENARLYEAEQKRRHIAETLRQTSTVLSSTLELDEVLGLILQQLRQVIPYDSASVQRLLGERLEIAACQGFEGPDKVVDLVFPLDPKFPNYGVVTTKAPLAIEDVSQDYPHFKDEADSYESGHIRSWLGVPLMVKDQVIGMIALDRTEARPYTAAESELAMAFANQAAIAIENARLYEQAQAHSRYHETLQRINATLRSTLPLDEVLETVARGAGEALGYVGSLIVIPDTRGERLTMGAVWGDRFIDASVRFTGLEVGSFSLPLTAKRNPIAQAYLTGELQYWTKETEQIVVGVEPAVSPKLAPLIARAMEAEMAACVPLPVGDKVVGVLSVFSSREQLPDEERAILLGLADQAGLAIQNAQLYQAAKQELAERKRAEEALRESEERLKLALEAANDGLYDWNMQTDEAYFSRRYYTMLGYEPYEMPASSDTWIDLLHPDDREYALNTVNEHIEKKRDSHEIEFRLRTKSGGWRWVLSRGRVIERDVSGRPIRMVGTHVDITERKRAEELLQALNTAALAMERALTPEEIFTSVAEELKKLGFSCMVLLTDESQSRLFPKYLSYETGALEASEKLVGLKREDFSIPIETVDVYRKVVWEKKTVFVENAEDAMRQILPEPAKRFAKQIVKMLKVPKYIPAPLIVEDKVIGALSVQSDDLTEDDVPTITAFAHQMAAAWRKAELMQDLQNSLEELKRTQAQLVQAQKMESIGQLAAGIAHDFNNLLTPIGGFAELLMRKAPEGSRRHEYLRQIKVAAERAAALTCQLRLFTRQEIGERLSVQLNSVVEETRALLEHSIPKEITIELRLESELWAVEADPSQISQVLMNLCVNARDAMPDGGTLTLETRNMTLDEEYARMVLEARPGRYVRLSISDTGGGMSPEVKDRLFEPFFTTKEIGKGTGLGLAVVYGIVKGHGGFINVYSQEGRGSMFHVYLPAMESAVKEREVEGLELPSGTETILFVDDEEMVRALGQRVLELCGYTVLMAEDGVQALEVYQAHQGEIGLVVLDVIMPQMGGQKCLRHLRELDPQVKVLISTGYTVRGLAEELLAEGALGVVEKPFRLQDFAVAVRAALDES